ncbi:UDP-N-acetylmuramate dehydrogenase [Candidatus Roizmanbacteria bacterium]|nr:UDP-N-acetylmuramate dehydrogenase [Candidatus Roizmanbacteria bacterium]
MNKTMQLERLELTLGKGRVQAEKDILPYFTLRTKVIAEYYFEANSREDWENVGKVKAQQAIPLFILGGGSNLAVTQERINGLVVRNTYIKKEITNETDSYVDLKVSSGYPMARLAMETAQEGHSSLEYQMGLPGTVGGAIYMNSKWTHPVSYCGDSLISASLLTDGGVIKEVDHDYFQFAYDSSILQKTKEIVIDAVFRLKKESPESVQKRAQEALAYRKATQPHGVATSGCFFRNISEEQRQKLNVPTRSAGYLIDRAGLKNTSVGDFYISEKHANFIINRGNGKASDLLELVKLIKDRVKEKFGVELKEEVIIWKMHTK